MKPLNRREALKILGASIAATAMLPIGPPIFHAASGAYVTTSSIENFLQLSAILTGLPQADLDVNLGLEYIERLEKKNPGVLTTLLQTFQNLVKEAQGNPQKLIELVDTQIWQDQSCAKILINEETQYLCNANQAPECCIARDIPMLWYAGSLMELTTLQVPQFQFVYGSSASYLGAMAWYVAGAHPQAQCGGTYGYWAVKPGEPHPMNG